MVHIFCLGIPKFGMGHLLVAPKQEKMMKKLQLTTFMLLLHYQTFIEKFKNNSQKVS